MSAFLGMRGTGDWLLNQVPESWAQYILYEYPNGSAPLFAMQSMFRQESVDSHTYHWWTKTLPTQAGTLTSIYIDAGLGTEYVYASHQSTHGIANATVYAKMALALAQEFKPGHIVRMVDTDQLDAYISGRVIDVVYNGASSYVAVKLFEADDNHSSASSYNMATMDRIMIIDSVYPDGSVAPEALAYDPVEYDNYVQNHRHTLDLTHQAIATSLRTGDAYKEAKRECAELHSIGIEKGAFFNYKYSGTGDNRQPLRVSQGLYEFMKENNSTNIKNYATDTASDFAGKTWLQAGEYWLDKAITDLATYIPRGEVMAFCGNEAWLGIQRLAKTYGNIQLTPSSPAYGISVNTWIGALNVHFKTHPLFSYETTFKKMVVLLLPENCKFCPLVGGGLNLNTRFEKDMQLPGQHAKVDGYATTGGWKWYHPNQFMILKNVGADNTVS
jgi:hypothetical protein